MGKVVITGASGNVGTALLRAAPPDWKVVGLARHRPSVASEPYDTADWVECDVGAPEAQARLTEVFAGADAVVHLAWAVQPGRADARRRTNLTGSANVLAAAAAAGVGHLVVASSVAAYAPAARWSRVGEEWPRTGVPDSAYSADKAELERMLLGYRGRLAVVRPCAIVQPDAASEFARWIVGPWLPRRAVGRVPVPLWRGLRLQVVHADDVARALRLVVEAGATGAFNLAAEPVLPARRLAALLGAFLLPMPRRLLLAVAGLAWRVGLQPMHPGWLHLADRAPLISTERARTELGWQPEHDADVALAAVVEAMRHGRGAASRPLAPDTGTSRWSRRLRVGRPVSQSQAVEGTAEEGSR